jgi:hypothetical protein
MPMNFKRAVALTRISNRAARSSGGPVRNPGWGCLAGRFLHRVVIVCEGWPPAQPPGDVFGLGAAIEQLCRAPWTERQAREAISADYLKAAEIVTRHLPVPRDPHDREA